MVNEKNERKNYTYCDECERLIRNNWWSRHIISSIHKYNLRVLIQNIMNEQLMTEFETEEESIGSERERETWESYNEIENTNYFDNILTLEDFNREHYNHKVDEILRRNRN